LADYADVAEKVQPNTLIFTGSFSYLPNYEAMFWFLHDIYPQVQQQIPDVCLQITGNHGNRPLPTTKNVYLTGYVDDVRPLIARSWASIVPLRTGGGTRLKILEAMALGTPVIATAKGAQGIEAEPGKHLLIADTPQAFAEAIIELLQSPSLCQQLAANAYNLIQEKYDWVKVMPRFLNLVEHIAHPKPLL
jgi:glycosyltransferase involved in cell wall biosynthesis